MFGNAGSVDDFTLDKTVLYFDVGNDPPYVWGFSSDKLYAATAAMRTTRVSATTGCGVAREMTSLTVVKATTSYSGRTRSYSTTRTTASSA